MKTKPKTASRRRAAFLPEVQPEVEAAQVVPVATYDDEEAVVRREMQLRGSSDWTVEAMLRRTYEAGRAAGGHQ